MNLLKTLIVIPMAIVFALPSVGQDKPLLSEAIKNTLETKGVAEAKKQFQNVETIKKNYSIDHQGMLLIGAAYGQAGDVEKASAYLEIASPYFQVETTTTMPLPPPNSSKPPATPEPTAAKADDPTPRSDLERFSGFYAKGGNADGRYISVQPTCDGKYLLFAPSWGDASPFYLTSTGELTFTTSDSQSQLTIQFEVDENGSGKKIIHDFSYIDNPLDYFGPLSDKFDPCSSRVR